MSNGHWAGLTPDPVHNIGFIYLIEDLTTGYKYVGKKNYWVAKQGVSGCKSKCQDRGDPKWNPKCWRDSNWRVYKGSSKALTQHIKDNPMNNYRFTILRNCRSRGVLSYCECEEQYDRRVLTHRLDNGKYEYFNLSIGAIRFRPKVDVSYETRKKNSVATTSQMQDPQQRTVRSKSQKGNKSCVGRVVSDETKKKISEALKGNKNSVGRKMSSKTRLALAKANTKKHNMETHTKGELND